MNNKYMFKKFDSLITSCKKHISIHSNLRNIIIKLICIIEESESKLGVKYGIVCVNKTYSLVDLIIRFCNIHLFKCNDLNYIIESKEVNNYLKDLYSSLDSVKISKSTTKTNLLKTINEILYKFSYYIQGIVLHNIEVETNKTRQKNRIEEMLNVHLESDTSLVKNIINYFENEFEESKDEIYKFIDQL